MQVGISDAKAKVIFLCQHINLKERQKKTSVY